MAGRVSALLGKKGEEMYQELRKLLDKVLDWIKTNRKRFEERKISKSNYDEFYQLYGKLIAKGSSRIKRKYVSEYRKIIREADSYSVRKQFERDLARKKPKPKSSKIYLQRRKQAYINFEKGNAFERIFLKIEGGIKPKSSVKTALTNRFPDNIKNGISRELKSGHVKHTKRFEKQFKKDIDILRRELDEDISKIE